MINGLDLFSGIGGISLALHDIVKPLAYVEIDKYCQKILSKNMEKGNLHKAPIYSDVKEFRGGKLNERPDIIYGGFPCQDISVGNRNAKGLAGKRSGLFREIVRLTKETKAPFVFLENVPAIRLRGLPAVIEAYTELGYDCRWTIVSAKEVGAHHIRKRWFFLAHASGKGSQRQRDRAECRKKEIALSFGKNEDMAHSKCDKSRLQSRWSSGSNGKEAPNYLDSSWWFSEPDVDRVAHGIPNGVDRVKGLGNAVVPLQARTAFFKLLGVSND